MSGRNDDLSERNGLEFFGALSASVTHELNNVLSIIDQVCGLLGDVVVAAGAGRAIEAQRIKVAQERLQRQARKGIDIVDRFNKFCHSVDSDALEFDVGVETENIVSLTRRFAELKKIRLESTTIEEGIGVLGDAFFFQQTVFIGLRALVEDSGEGDTIEVGVRRDGGTALISIDGTGCGAMKAGDSRLDRLAGLMLRMGGGVRVGEGERGGTALQLRVPVTPDNAGKGSGKHLNP